MEKSSKRKILIWVVIILVIINISSLATIWFHRIQNKRTNRTEIRDQRVPRETRNRDRRNNGQDMRREFSRRFQNDLNLTDTQSTAVDSIHSHYFDQRRELTQNLAALKSKLDEELASVQLDQDSLDMLITEQSSYFNDLNNNAVQMNLAIRTVLNEEQVKSYTSTLKKERTRRLRSRRSN
jgi:hypothetical protein